MVGERNLVGGHLCAIPTTPTPSSSRMSCSDSMPLIYQVQHSFIHTKRRRNRPKTHEYGILWIVVKHKDQNMSGENGKRLKKNKLQ